MMDELEKFTETEGKEILKKYDYHYYMNLICVFLILMVFTSFALNHMFEYYEARVNTIERKANEALYWAEIHRSQLEQAKTGAFLAEILYGINDSYSSSSL